MYRGAKVLKKIATQPIIVCGCGAIGSNLVDNMIRQGFSDITVIDFDRVEDHNRHTQIWMKRDVGQLKTTILKNLMFNVRGVTIKDIPRKLEASNADKLLSGNAIVVDGFDNVEARNLVTTHCNNKKMECLHVGLAKDYAEVVWNEFYTVPKGGIGPDVCEYPMARNIIMLAVAVATEVLIRFVSKGEKENYDITLGDFKIMPKTGR